MPPPVGNLSDFVDGVTENSPLDVEITVDANTNKLIIFHNKPFNHRINCFEYNIGTSELYFIMQGGEKRTIGDSLPSALAKYMHNTHQILVIEMNDETGDANRGEYIPVLMQQN